jgi:hypothetical protein
MKIFTNFGEREIFQRIKKECLWMFKKLLIYLLSDTGEDISAKRK